MKIYYHTSTSNNCKYTSRRIYVKLCTRSSNEAPSLEKFNFRNSAISHRTTKLIEKSVVSLVVVDTPTQFSIIHKCLHRELCKRFELRKKFKVPSSQSGLSFTRTEFPGWFTFEAIDDGENLISDASELLLLLLSLSAVFGTPIDTVFNYPRVSSTVCLKSFEFAKRTVYLRLVRERRGTNLKLK